VTGQSKAALFDTKAYSIHAVRCSLVAVQLFMLAKIVLSNRRLRAWLPSLIFAPVCLYLLAHRGEYLWVDSLNLLIHEAGHLLFSGLPAVWHAAGGSLLQVGLPAALVIHFRWYRMPWGERLSLAWLGQNFLCLSVYAADAQARVLTLQGGTTHDWAYLLGHAGWLDFDGVVAGFFSVLALISFAGLLLLPLSRR